MGTNLAIAKLVPSDYAPQFGTGLYIGALATNNDGSTIVMTSSGNQAAYVFTKPSGGWSSTTILNESAKLTPSDSTSFFGRSVTMSRDANTIVAGDPERGDEDGLGRIYLYAKKAADSWSNGTERAQLTSTDNRDNALLGSSVSISGDSDTVVAGAPSAPLISADPLETPGYVYVFQFPTGGTGWVSATQNAEFWASDGKVGDAFGESVAVNEDGTVIAIAGGSAGYVFTRTGQKWTDAIETMELVASNPSVAVLGPGVAISDDGSRIFLGSVKGASEELPGSVYAFARPTWGWATVTLDDGTIEGPSPMTETGQLTAGSVLEFGEFNLAASSDGGTVVAGDPFDVTSAYLVAGDMTFPQAAISGRNLLLGNQPVGTVSSGSPVTISNVGTAPLHVTAEVITAGRPFSITNNCLSTTIAPGSWCTEWVTFAPVSLGAASANLIFTDDADGFPESAQVVALSGTGTVGTTTTALANVLPSPALVGQQAVVTFAVSPQSADTLTPTGTVTVSASPAGTHCTATLPANSCMLPAFVSPVTQTITASYSGDANFLGSNSTGVSEKVVDYQLAVSPTTQTVSSGHSGVFTLTLTGYNGFSGTIAISCKGGPAKSSCSVSPASINLTGTTATAKATLSTLQGATKAVYPMTFTATYGATSRTANGTVTVK